MNKTTSGKPQFDAEMKHQKKPYSQPKLQEYGNVGEITRENSMSASVDGAGMTGDSNFM